VGTEDIKLESAEQVTAFSRSVIVDSEQLLYVNLSVELADVLRLPARVDASLAVDADASKCELGSRVSV
jgi:hypothetical protein